MAFPYAPVVVDPREAEVVERHAAEFYQCLIDRAFMVVERFKNIDQCVLFHNILLGKISAIILIRLICGTKIVLYMI